MKLTDLLDILHNGYLKTHGAGAVDSTTGLPINLDRLVIVINAALNDLHKRFIIRKEEVRLMASASINRYELTPNTVYLDGYPMVSEIIRILEVYDKDDALCPVDTLTVKPTQYAEHTPTGYGINIFMPSFNVIGTPKGYAGILRVIYQAGATKIPTLKEGLNVSASVVTIDIPEHFADAICLFVCSRIFTTINPDQGLAAANSMASTYLRMYEEECNKLGLLGVTREQVSASESKFELGGWV